MPKTRRYASRCRSTPAQRNDNSPLPTTQNASLSQPHSEPIIAADPSPQSIDETNPSNDSATQIGENPSSDEISTCTRKSNKYWTVNLIGM